MDRQIEKKSFLRRYAWYVAAAAALAALLVWIVLGTTANTMTIDATDITISDVTRGKFDDYVRLNGQVLPIQVVQISPEEGGIVREKVVEEGTRVRKGDVILRLSNSNLDLQILNAEAELAEKQNLLRNTQVAMQQDRLNNRTEQATLDTDCDRKRRAYEQNARLYKERLISKEVYLQSREDYKLARRKQSLISQRLKQDSLYRHVQMAQMEDNLDNMRKNVLLVRDRKNKLEVRSAIDGELGLLDVELGQNIAAGQNIGQINDLSDFKVQAQIDEHYIDRVRPGLSASFSRDGKTYRLRVRKVYPEVRNGTFRTDFVFVGERPAQMRSGQTFYVELALGKSQQATLIPRGTFFQTTGGNWIFVLDKSGRKAYRRNISIARQNPQYYEVTDGLEPGERVITSGYEAFKDNEVLVIK
ncbi:MAG: efflux RND transporter periplasmic adaptor subunit [Prevotella sp.]|uniref:efflux RND transporter periplasmic adaptor subunit n=1 Tax=Leyella stercorea TaxID=363265 RepID=UPI002802B725|nr:efflux RND transporter periplasmic adaptor subunit [Leyella stercorea]MDY3705089.1 efflux RND transporter periplasmic adaptor subunit [Prevotella sp.]MDY3786079.1 efflux RND transporter periplasmic adaptor subunit [Prevotella sp.]MDY4197670.1 efflux RND transporter periplasmic adaptor subunit [Prevotella sp.]